MIKFSLYFFLLVGFAFWSCRAEDKNSLQVKTVDAVKFRELISDGKGIVLDVRTPEEVQSGHIEHASAVNFYDKNFISKINLMKKDKTIYVYCRSGGRSLKASEILLQNGFSNVVNLQGGITDWENKGFPVARTENGKDEKIQEMTLAEFQKILKAQKKVLVDFHTKWCSPCVQMAPIVDRISEKFKDRATVIRIDIDKSEEIRSAYQIQGVPVFILFQKEKEKWKHSGMIAEAELVDVLNKF